MTIERSVLTEFARIGDSSLTASPMDICSADSEVVKCLAVIGTSTSCANDKLSSSTALISELDVGISSELSGGVVGGVSSSCLIAHSSFGGSFFRIRSLKLALRLR